MNTPASSAPSAPAKKKRANVGYQRANKKKKGLPTDKRSKNPVTSMVTASVDASKVTPDDPASKNDGEDADDDPSMPRLKDRVDYNEDSEEEHEEDDDADYVIPRDSLGRRIVTKEEAAARRHGMCCFFVFKHGAEPEERGRWNGRSGIAADIARSLSLPKGCGLRSVKSVMRCILMCEEEVDSFTGNQVFPRKFNNHLTPQGSFQEQLVADLIEDGNSFTHATHLLNEHRREEGISNFVGRSTVYQAAQRLKPKVTAIAKRQQGSLNLESNWCQANYGWATQLLIRCDVLPPDEVEKLKLEDGTLPTFYDKAKLKPLNLDGVTFWDEAHKQMRGGNKAAGSKKERRFKRDANGKIDPNGEYRPRSTELKMKHTEEARFSFGVAKRGDKGFRLPIFEHTGKKLVTHKDYQIAFEKEKTRPKGLVGECAPWFVPCVRPEGVFYTEDSVKELPKVGDKAVKSLNDMGIPTVREFKDKLECDPTLREKVVKECRAISQSHLLTLLDKASNAVEGPPEPVDYRKADNPHEARFGECWKDEVLKSAAMTKLRDIRELVEHIVKESTAFFKGTEFENEWFFCHDALSLLTANETQEWMRKEGYIKHWIRPEEKLNSHLGSFANRPPGNNADLMPLDSSLNKDHDDCVIRHVAVTSHLSEDDPRKFSMTTPNRVAHAYKRVWDHPNVNEGSPTSERIVQDIKRTHVALSNVYKSRGLNAKTNVPGHRGTELREQAGERRGGARKKKLVPMNMWYHEDARCTVTDLIAKSKKAFYGDVDAIESVTTDDLELDSVVFEEESD